MEERDQAEVEFDKRQFFKWRVLCFMCGPKPKRSRKKETLHKLDKKEIKKMKFFCFENVPTKVFLLQEKVLKLESKRKSFKNDFLLINKAVLCWTR